MMRRILALGIALLASLMVVTWTVANDIEPMVSAETLTELSSEQITEVQRLLAAKGYEIDALDGTLNSQTVTALRAFQGKHNLSVTGVPNHETLRALSTDMEKLEFFGLAPYFKTP